MKKPLWTTALLALILSSCGGGYEPFVGVTSGKNKSYYTPVEATNYDNESIDGGDVNGGCIPDASSIDLEDVGKRRYGGGDSCGGFLMPATWKPGMTVKINWKVEPYPRWLPGYYPQGGVNQEKLRIMKNYDEYYTAVVPLPPPPPNIGTDLGKGSGLQVHFLACNQIFLSYGTLEERRDKEYIKRDFDLFRKSQKLCSKRPVVKSMADYRKNKARMDAVKKERANIPQIILPQYIEELKKAGKYPMGNDKK